jgi:hypothetical protein
MKIFCYQLRKFVGEYKEDRANGPGQYHSFKGKIYEGNFEEKSIQDDEGFYTGTSSSSSSSFIQ